MNIANYSQFAELATMPALGETIISAIWVATMIYGVVYFIRWNR